MRSRMMQPKPWRRVLAGAACAAGLAFNPGTTPHAAAADLALDVVPLLSQVVGSGLLEMTGVQDRLELALPLPPGGRLVGAELRLNFVNSRALAIESSRVTVEINGQQLAALPLRNDGETSRVTMPLPVELLKPTGNRLTFTSELRTPGPCTATSVRELWAQADPVNSYLLLTYERGVVPITLSGLEPGAPLVDPGVLQLVTVGSEQRPAVLQALALAAQGYALRHGARPLRVVHLRLGPQDGPQALSRELRAPIPGVPQGTPLATLVVGTSRELQAALGPGLRGGAGSSLELMANPGTGGPPLLVVSGADDTAMLQAAARFADLSSPLPEQAGLSFAGQDAMTVPPMAGMEGGQEVALRDLGFSVRRIPTSGRHEPAVDIEMPADFYALDNRKAELILDYDFVANLSRYAVINVFVNGQHVTHIPLDSEGGQVRGRRVSVLLNSFRPGTNHMVFEASLGPEQVAACNAWREGQRAVTIHPSSRFRIPVYARAIQAPVLSLLTTTGYPFSRPDLARPSAVLLADPSSETLSSAITILAKMAQMAGRPMQGLQLTHELPQAGANLLVVGALPTVPDELLATAPLDREHLRAALSTGGDARAPGERAAAGSAGAGLLAAAGLVGAAQAAEPGVLEDPLAASGEYARRLQNALPTTRFRARIAESNYFGVPAIPYDGIILTTLPDPKAERTVTFVTAADPRRLARAVAGLVDDALWERIDGDVTGWRLFPQEVVTARLRERVAFAGLEASSTEKILFVTSFLADKPAYWVAGILVWLTLLAVLTWFWLGQVMRKSTVWRETP